MGNIKGAKRGAYKKTTNEKLSINKVIEKSSVKSRGIKEIVIEKHNNRVNSVEPIKSELVIDSDNDNSKISNESVTAPETETQSQTFQETSGEEKLNIFFSEYEQAPGEENTEVKNETINETINEPLNEPNKVQNIGNQFTSSQSSKPSLNVLVNGYMLLTIMDIVFPIGIKFIFGLFNKEAKSVNISALKLEPEQKESLRPMADQVAVYIFEKVNPLTMFVLMSSFYYATNLQSEINKNKER
jgi:hypothetical protein